MAWTVLKLFNFCNKSASLQPSPNGLNKVKVKVVIAYCCLLLRIFVFRKVGTLRSNDTGSNEHVQKTIGLISKTTTLHVRHTFLYISCPFLPDYDVKMLYFAFYGGRKQAKTKFFLLFVSLDMVIWNTASGGFVYNWKSKWVGIIAI